MADASPAAPTPANGAGSKSTVPSAPPAPTTDTAKGPQTPAPSGPPVRGADGKFTSANPEPKPPAKLRIKDQDFEEEAAWTEIQRGRQASKLLTEAQKRAQAADEREKAYEARKARAKEDLGALMDDLGLTPEQERALLAKRLHARHIQPETLTPEQKELAEAKAWRAEREAKDKAAEDEKTSAQKKAQLDQDQQALSKEIEDAARAGKIPSAPAAMRRIIAKALQFEERGLAMPLEQVAAVVREEVAKDIGEFSASTEIADRKQLWGDEVFRAEERKWLAHFQSKLKAAPVSAAPKSTPPPKPGERRWITPQEFTANLNRRK